ncbi:MAG: type II toxin-antitoxin system ParD family antitoxin [Nitrococcus sp.]|nr:type II toxin-antitoxin system ParD family antitoxin [Nitrococcus sp.]
MSTMNISLPDDLRAFVDEQVAARGYASTSEYLRELIRKQKDIEQLRQKLLEGASSPVVGVMDEAWFESLRERARRRPTE